jgi:hypothetical protein
MTLYVSSTGSDSNSGLTSGTAFLTLQKALDAVPLRVKHTVTINVAAGTLPDTSLQVPSFTCEGGSVVVVGTMEDFIPATGIATGTFDASFAGQPLLQTAVCAGGGWSVSEFETTTGVWVQVTSGTSNGIIYPIASNTATTLDLPFNVTTTSATANLMGQTFKFVRPATLLNITAISYIRARGGAFYLDFQRLRMAPTQSFFVDTGATVKFTECSFVGRNGGIISSGLNTSLTLSKCLGRGTDYNSTFVFTNGLCFVLARNCVFQRGDRCFNMASGSILTFTGIADNFNASVGAIAGSSSYLTLSAPTLIRNCIAPGGGVSVSGGTLLLTSTTANGVLFKNNYVGAYIGGVTDTAIARVGAATRIFSTVATGVVFDGNGTAIKFVAQSSIQSAPHGSFPLGSLSIVNSTGFGVNMAGVGVSSCMNVMETGSTLGMSGNVSGDFTLDGTTAVSLASLRGAPNKTVTEAARFNRLVEE